MGPVERQKAFFVKRILVDGLDLQLLGGHFLNFGIRVRREAVHPSSQAVWTHISSPASATAIDLPNLNLLLPFEPWKNLEEILKRLSSSTGVQVSLAELPTALDNTLMVPRSGLQHAAVASYGYKLQCLRIQVRQIARERDKARLDLEKVEGHCLQLGRELDEQYVALEHTQSKLKDFQAEIEAKELLLQQAVSHQAKLEADTQFLQGKEASLQGRLNHVMKENTQLQNKVTEMAEKLVASEKLVLELQKELNCVVKDKLGQVEPHSPELLNQSECFAEIVLEYERQCQINYYEKEIELMRKNFERERKDSEESFKAEMRKMEDQKRDLEETVAKGELCQLLEENSLLKSQLGRLQQELRLAKERGSNHDVKNVSKLGREKVEELAEIAELTASGEKSKGDVSHLNVKMHQLGCELTERKASHGAGPGTVQLQSQRLAEAERLRGAEMAARLEHHQQHAACWMETELLQQQLRASQEKLLEAKANLSLAQTRHALQLQQAKARMNNVVPKKQFEQLQTSLREEQCKAQQLQENLHRQAEQTCRQLVRIQEEHERLLQAAVEQAEGLEHNLRSAEAVLAERAAQLKDAQAQISRNKLLIEDLREENRGFAMALQVAELKQKSTEEKNQLLEEQASALKQLIGKITPASLSG
ncbi:ninein-like protein isoform X12 [Harpia harpyja]|uniref:ninein-like protein isoform X12 n=1 Tax=Harpia harpyja TaxID=202280 RepID=UPI0022B0CCF4|nr:ninein-like protein isoform X12 [Harpia harpyja]